MSVSDCTLTSGLPSSVHLRPGEGTPGGLHACMEKMFQNLISLSCVNFEALIRQPSALAILSATKAARTIATLVGAEKNICQKQKASAEVFVYGMESCSGGSILLSCGCCLGPPQGAPRLHLLEAGYPASLLRALHLRLTPMQALSLPSRWSRVSAIAAWAAFSSRGSGPLSGQTGGCSSPCTEL